ncbi:hypothetical protein K491DRAFT_684918 [Lophiostoma macrostomum CBS 122681]|uniref:Cytochrome P450 n=1 Tax=Lophiostoma macrostomum CBS 122681 TaxID=1314788 RepID=A0A6A6SL42_9PLEO|nr:hypothetical protein K491DRAFT_684918 [Lophiostoma macrostomum CBS 122681]
MVLPSILGSAFVHNYPDTAADIFTIDESFYKFMMDLPSWIPITGMRESSNARDRVKRSMGELHAAISATDRGELLPGGSNGPCDAKLLSEIREEVAPYATSGWAKGVSGAEPSLKLDSAGIRHETPLLQSAMLEAMRLYTLSTSYKYINNDFAVEESEVDKLVRANGGRLATESNTDSLRHSSRSYKLRKGDILCVPLGLQQRDPRYWEDESSFNARRFLIQNNGPHSKQDEPEYSVDYTQTHPWGVGATKCRGIKFSHEEVLNIAVAVLICWDIVPADPAAGWEHPRWLPAGGTAIPKADLRVKLRRRI